MSPAQWPMERSETTSSSKIDYNRAHAFAMDPINEIENRMHEDCPVALELSNTRDFSANIPDANNWFQPISTGPTSNEYDLGFAPSYPWQDRFCNSAEANSMISGGNCHIGSDQSLQPQSTDEATPSHYRRSVVSGPVDPLGSMSEASDLDLREELSIVSPLPMSRQSSSVDDISHDDGKCQHANCDFRAKDKNLDHRKSNCRRHIREKHERSEPHRCLVESCQKTYMRSDGLKRHFREKHQS